MADLIDEFVDIVTPYCDAPSSFIEAGGYYLISTLLGRYFRCTQMPQRGRPNVWFILSSIPGRMRRSTIQHYTDYIYQRAMMGYYEKFNIAPHFSDKEEEKLTEEEKMELTLKFRKKLIYDSMIEEGTPEGIMDKIEDAEQDVFTIVSTEIGSVFQRMTKRDYHIGVSTLLSKLYYGEGGSIALSRRGGKPGGRTIPQGLYVTMLAGMQEPRWYLDTSMVRQGLLRRIIIIFVEPKDLNRWLPPMKGERDEIYSKLDDYADRLTNIMVNYHRTVAGYIPQVLDLFFNPKAMEKINTRAKELDDALKEKPTNANIYRQSMWEHLAKLAMLRRIAENRLEELGGLKQVTVDEDNLSKAGEFLDPVFEKTEDIIRSIGEEPQPIRTFEEPLERVWSIIAGGGRNGITRTDLYRESNMRSDELDSLISTLIRSGRIVQLTAESTGGRASVRYAIKP
jgi:hypothetical protein